MEANILVVFPIELLAFILLKNVESIRAFGLICKFPEPYHVLFMQLRSQKIYNQRYLAKLMLAALKNNRPIFANSIVTQVLCHGDATTFKQFTMTIGMLTYEFKLIVNTLIITATHCKDKRQWGLQLEMWNKYNMLPSLIFDIFNDARSNKLDHHVKITFMTGNEKVPPANHMPVQIKIFRSLHFSGWCENIETILDLNLLKKSPIVYTNNHSNIPQGYSSGSELVYQTKKLFEQQIIRSNLQFDPDHLNHHLAKFYRELYSIASDDRIQ